MGSEKPSQVTSLDFAGSTRIRNKAIVAVKQKGSKTVLLVLQGRGADGAHLFPLRQTQISASSTLKEAFASTSALPNPTTVHPKKVTVALLQRNLSTARADTPQLCLQHCQGKDMPHTLIPHPPHRGVPPQEGAIAGSFCPHQPEAPQWFYLGACICLIFSPKSCVGYGLSLFLGLGRGDMISKHIPSQ